MTPVPDYRDPKLAPVNEYETTDDAWIAHYPDNMTGDYRPLPNSPEHTPEWLLNTLEPDLDELTQWRALGRALLEDRDDETAWEWLAELLARE